MVCIKYEFRDVLNFVISFAISDNWRHKNWSVENIFKICALLGYYAARSDNFLPMFQNSLSVPNLDFKNPKNVGKELPLLAA